MKHIEGTASKISGKLILAKERLTRSDGTLAGAVNVTAVPARTPPLTARLPPRYSRTL